MTTFGIYHPDLELQVKYRVLSGGQAQDFLDRYEPLGRGEYLNLVLHTCIANVNSEVKPMLVKFDPLQADEILVSLYNGCIMLNPLLDISTWFEITNSYNFFQRDLVDNILIVGKPFQIEAPGVEEQIDKKTVKPLNISKAKLNSMPKYLKSKLVGQDEAIEMVFNSLKRHQVGLADIEKPVGVFLLCGQSGSGKTYLAKELHDYLFDQDYPMIRLDCGEYQHKHENQKLLGSPVGYAGSDEPGYLSKCLAKSPQAVFLLDEVEKAHPHFWDTFLKVFDEGQITDSKGNNLDFRSCIFILTSNLGNDKVIDTTYGNKPGFSTGHELDYESQQTPKRAIVERMTLEAVRSFFRPELLNRLDEIVVFNHLTKEDYIKIADLELSSISKKLGKKSFNFKWTKYASALLVQKSSKANEGARGMAKVRRNCIEDPLASLLLSKSHPKGTEFELKVSKGEFIIK